MSLSTENSKSSRWGKREREYVIDWRDPDIVDQIAQAVTNHVGVPGQSGSLEMIQTHISTVFLVDDQVLKFKRPVDVGFADFRRLSQRKHYCQEELRLNRRLAKDVYLEVIPLYFDGVTFSFQPQAQIVDYAVAMRRLPPEKMLDARIINDQLSSSQMEGLAELLVNFHTTGTSRMDISTFGSLQLISQNWKENFTQVLPFLNITISGERHQAMQQEVFGFMTSHRELFQERVDNGFIRDGHGDLRCEHIYLDDLEAGEGSPTESLEVRIIDCIEFNERFRFGDVASDLAFLLMDMAAMGRPDLSQEMLSYYLAFSGDTAMMRLIPFYASYRAFVRGKVLSFKLSDKNLDEAEQYQLLSNAQRYFDLAWAFCKQMRPPVLLLMAGLMGSGKSALGKELAKRTGIAVYSSDVVRKELAKKQRAVSKKTTAEAGYGEGIYTSQWTDKTYKALFQMAKEELSLGRSVILDASFTSTALRKKALKLAKDYGAEGIVVECRLNEVENLRRLLEREAQGGSVSDGRAELFDQQKKTFEPITELSESQHLIVSTHRSVKQTVKKILEDQRLVIPPRLFSTLQ